MKTCVVFDIPKSCSECFCEDYDSRYGDSHCRIYRKDNFGYDDDKEVSSYRTKRPEWCPLKLLPEEKPVHEPKNLDYENVYAEGFNACLDEIIERGNT